MMWIFKASFLVIAGILGLGHAQTLVRINTRDVRELSELSDIYGAIEAFNRGRVNEHTAEQYEGNAGLGNAADAGEGCHPKHHAKTVIELVTMTVGSDGKNGTSQKTLEWTVTITRTENSLGGDIISTILLSFVTETVTVTALPKKNTQMVTITAAAGGTACCSEAAGTGHASLAETAAAATATCALGAGTSGGMIIRTKTLPPDGCSCICLCGPELFSAGSVLRSHPQVSATLSPTSGSVTQTASSLVTSAVQVSSSTIPTPFSIVPVTGTPTILVSQAITTGSPSLSPTASIVASAVQSTNQAGPPLLPSSLSTLVANPSSDTSGATATGTGVAGAEPPSPINVSTFSLTSSLVLGSLAQPTINGKI